MALSRLWFWLSLIPSAVFLYYIVERNIAAFRARPRITRKDIVYQEFFASGCSEKNFLTKLGGGNNCLRLVVTGDLLWVTSWFPFSLIAPIYDGVHVIPLARITSVERSRQRFTSLDGLLLSYSDAAGGSHTLRLVPKGLKRFIEAIEAGVKVPIRKS